ncbi:FaeA/PapI family transcriptional regulator [Escherichia sp. TW14182]|uniref:FaeA/PapI family transcriptional regulator n=1 Tax=Escherichia sp. TW14182 TaxID=754336 RepID=UPI0009892105
MRTSVRHISKPISYFKIHLLSGISGGQLISVYQAQYYLAKLQEKGEIVRSEKRQGQRCIWTIK